MSMLVPPQMMNTMVPASHDGAPSAAAFTDAFYADPVRRYMLPVFRIVVRTGRRTRTPPATPSTSTTCGWPRA